MYTVLLVDDEDDVLESLVNSIDWPVYGIDSILTASDGVSAYNILRTIHVDLLITDIRMPHLDGIALIRHVHEIYPNIRCILLTSHKDFQYAKDAISLGVENYLLKPVNINELDNSVRKSIENLSMEKNVVHTLFVENVLYRWLTDDISPEELSERAKHIDINIYFRNYCVVVIKSLSRKFINQLLSGFYSSVRQKHDIYRFVNYDGQHVSILGGHSVSQQYIADALQRIADTLPQCEFHAAIGNVVDSYEEVCQSYQSAMDCLNTRSFSTPRAICLANKKIADGLTSLQVSSIVEHLKNHQNEESNDNILPLFQDTLSGIFDYSLDELNNFISILSARLALQLSISGLVGVNEKDYITNNVYYFEEYPDENALLGWFENILSVCQALIRKHMQQLNPTVLLAMQYVMEHHTNHVSIKDFCNKHNMNASYLGVLFKKETGIYFKDYVNQIRISHARQLIKHKNLKIIDVCKAVGFNSTSYFILCFKKQTGLSPTQYRQMLSNDQI